MSQRSRSRSPGAHDEEPSPPRQYRWRQAAAEWDAQKTRHQFAFPEQPFPVNPRTGTYDYVGVNRLMDQLEDITYGRMKIPEVTQMRGRVKADGRIRELTNKEKKKERKKEKKELKKKEKKEKKKAVETPKVEEVD